VGRTGVFSKAYEIARHFTLPIVLSKRTVGGECSATIAAAVLINEDGWIVSAGHVFEEMIALSEEESATQQALAAIAHIEADASLNRQERRRSTAQARKPKKTAVERWSPWFGQPGRIERVLTIPGSDIGIAKLVDFKPVPGAVYPVFKDPTRGYDPGTSLCRLGFPFHHIVPTYDPENLLFRLPREAIPLPLFPNEGILTRFIELVPLDPITLEELPPLQVPRKTFETSTAALPGQSGGPIFDAEARIWGIQSATISYSLDMNTPEQQYYHVGVGIHAETILAIFKEHGIEYAAEPQEE
jgi:hypothetical protein